MSLPKDPRPAFLRLSKDSRQAWLRLPETEAFLELLSNWSIDAEEACAEHSLVGQSHQAAAQAGAARICDRAVTIAGEMPEPDLPAQDDTWVDPATRDAP